MYKRLNKKNIIYTPLSGTTLFINYEIETGTLEVSYADAIYHYINVPEKLWKEYITEIECGGSSGKFVNLKIKPFYKYIKIENEN